LCRKIVVELRIDVLFNFSNNDDDDTFDGSIRELQFPYVIITANNSGSSITTFEVMMQVLYWPIISVRLAVTNGISKTAWAELEQIRGGAPCLVGAMIYEIWVQI
jgi:hypothetical protein